MPWRTSKRTFRSVQNPDVSRPKPMAISLNFKSDRPNSSGLIMLCLNLWHETQLNSHFPYTTWSFYSTLIFFFRRPKHLLLFYMKIYLIWPLKSKEKRKYIPSGEQLTMKKTTLSIYHKIFIQAKLCSTLLLWERRVKKKTLLHNIFNLLASSMTSKSVPSSALVRW